MMESSRPVRVIFIGAGGVNFGGVIGPWNHSKRLEKLGGVEVVAVADPDLKKAYRVAIDKTKPQVAFIGSLHIPPYEHCTQKLTYFTEHKLLF